MAKKEARKGPAAKVKLEKLVFEIGCLGCGETSFTLPYEKGTHDMMTCQHCGEVTIAHVLPEGGIAAATLVQRDQAREEWMSDIEEHLGGLRLTMYQGAKTASGFRAPGKWSRLPNGFRTHVLEDRYGQLQVTIGTKVKGLVGEIKVNQTCTPDGSQHLRLEEEDIGPIDSKILVSAGKEGED